MPSFRITVAYDGTDFVGWQRQANGVSIQGLIEDALADIDGRPVAVAGAGRTDSGVHALAQVAGFTLERPMPPDVLVRAINAHLPDAIRVTAAAEVPASFHPRFAAHSKTYRYRILNSDVASPFERRYAWHVPGSLDLEAMGAAARMLEGEHDFAAFQAAGSDVVTTVRTVMTSRIAECGVRIDWGAPAPTAIRHPPCCVTRSPAPGFFATWCARLSARWWRSAAAAGRPTRRRSSWRSATARWRGRRRPPAACSWSPSTTARFAAES